MNKIFTNPFQYPLIYVFRINDKAHEGCLKVGQTSISIDNINIENITPNSKNLNEAAKKRIKQYTNTAGIEVDLIYTELAVYNDKKSKEVKTFKDSDIHRVFDNSNIQRVKISDSTSREWFKVDLDTVIRAINVIKEGKNTLSDIPSDKKYPIYLRPEQEEAVIRTIDVFKKENRMLWNAKMRFGKTITALELVKRQKYGKVLIVTHRPVVSSGWYDDFSKIFTDGSYLYGTKDNGNTIEKLLKSDKKFLYFASLQDLRGSEIVGGNYSKNKDVFTINWDLVIIDEAHEGTTTDLGEEVITQITKGENTKVLSLSGTPFNIISEYNENIYTWDYIMEQKSKREWDNEYFGDSNPYEDLPELKIYTYDLGNIRDFAHYSDYIDKAFNFREFFRVNQSTEEETFIHENDIRSFLDLITKEDNESNYPYSTKEYRDMFRHSLWMVPGVAEAKALSKMLKEHHIFGHGFEIINVAGAGDEEEPFNDALKKVQEAINRAGDNGYTITLSCGRLTTGVTVPEWTAVFMLSGSYSTSASSYLQTIFRVQSPCNKNGKVKRECYVFDFAPDRTLKMVAESVSISTQAGKTTLSDRVILGEFLNFCPVISIDGTKMLEYKTDDLLQQLKRVYAERVLINGFDDSKLYNDELLKLTELDLKKFEELKKIIKSSKSSHKTNDLDINKQGFTDEEYEEIERIERKPKKEITKEEQAKLEQLKKLKEQRSNAVAILKGISIRIPLMIYGAKIEYEKDIKINDFADNVDDISWQEFMPNGVTKDKFKEFIKYYDEDIFTVAARRIRDTVRQADELEPLERIYEITKLFRCFRNPDKETVLTPWSVVNRHLSDCLGGYRFMKFEPNEELLENPEFINQGQVTQDTVCNINANILDINAKSGLYPLYIAYSIYMKRCEGKENLTFEQKQNIWFDVISKNIFVLCKTEMAKLIVIRTLVGYNDKALNKVNVRYQEDIINTMKNESNKFIERIKKKNYWDKKQDNTKIEFDAIIGNPPYQSNIGDKGNSSLSSQLYPLFIETAIKIEPKYVTLITPSRWFIGQAQDRSFVNLREFVKLNNHFRKIFNYLNNGILFNNVEIKGGINYFLFDKDYVGQVEFSTLYDNKYDVEMRDLFEVGEDIVLKNSIDYNISKKVRNNKFIPLTNITTGRDAFHISSKIEILEKITSDKQIKGYVIVRCKNNVIRWIEQSKIKRNIEIFNKYKVFISKSAGDPEKDKKVIGKPYFADKKTVCTESFFPVGAFDNKIEALNLCKYMHTKFLRYMVSILKTSHNVTQIVYKFVPLQDFTDKSDIDWSKDIEDIDKQLYKKYDLSKDEIDYIESKIKPME